LTGFSNNENVLKQELATFPARSDGGAKVTAQVAVSYFCILLQV
jgi:hypothetical protein